MKKATLMKLLMVVHTAGSLREVSLMVMLKVKIHAKS